MELVEVLLLVAVEVSVLACDSCSSCWRAMASLTSLMIQSCPVVGAELRRHILPLASREGMLDRVSSSVESLSDLRDDEEEAALARDSLVWSCRCTGSRSDASGSVAWVASDSSILMTLSCWAVRAR